MMIALHCGAVLVLALGSWLLGFRMGVKYLTHALVIAENEKTVAACDRAIANVRGYATAKAQAEHMRNPQPLKHWPYRMH